MASPTLKSSFRRSGQLMPMQWRRSLWRRWGAWATELTLLVISVGLPWSVGEAWRGRSPVQLTPLNPVLALVEGAIAKALLLPSHQRRELAPWFTQLAWMLALIMPLLLGGFNLYLLQRTGKTLTKHWFGLRVVTATGRPPHLVRALLREGVGRWGTALSLAYLLWLVSAAPNVPLLLLLAGLALSADGLLMLFHPHQQTWHDWIAGTYVIPSNQPDRTYPGHFQVIYEPSAWEHRVNLWEDEDAAIAALVITPDPRPDRQFGAWMLQHPLLILLMVGLGGVSLVAGVVVGIQVYIQGQENQRQFKQQDNEMFLALLARLSPSESKTALEQRRDAILALGAIDDRRALPLLVNLLGQETNPVMLDALQQSLISHGEAAMPYLHRLNQSLQNQVDSLRFSPKSSDERRSALLRYRATQQAIAKILLIYSGQLEADLSRVALQQREEGPVTFTLVLDQTDLSRINWQEANLAGGSFQKAQFHSAGQDRRLNTGDDHRANLTGANLQAANFTGAIVTQVSLNRANLSRATLNHANFAQADLMGANLTGSRLLEADFSQANLSFALLTGANLGEANLSQANLHQARLVQVSALGTNLQAAKLVASDWHQADLSGANLQGANLSYAHLREARLVAANLTNAQLQNANFQGADLSSANLQGANLTGADLQDARLVPETPLAVGAFVRSDTPSMQKNGLKGVNFTYTRNLNEEQIAYICHQGGKHSHCP